MKLRTSNIILLCKHNHNYGDADAKTAIKKYMAEMCAGEEEWYDDEILLSILQNVVLDYLDTADRPSTLIWEYFETQKYAKYCDYNKSPVETWIDTLRKIKVRESDENGKLYYINGFNDDNIKVINECTGLPMFE